MRYRQVERRSNTIKTIEGYGIDYHPSLPMVESSSEVELKDIDTVCKKAISTLLAIQLACSISNNDDYEETKSLVNKFLENYDAANYLNSLEKTIFYPNYSNQNVLDVQWEYEVYWSLCWALGLIEREELDPPFNICDCEKSIMLILENSTYEDFKSKCKLRDVEEILDMLDLFYNYHWACVNKRLQPETNIGNLNPEVVYERRKGLEWLVSKEEDWNEISLDT